MDDMTEMIEISVSAVIFCLAVALLMVLVSELTGHIFIL